MACQAACRPLTAGLVGGFIRGSPVRRNKSMSIMAWKIMRRLPKPVLCVLTLFLLVAIARA
jgi:hypothetical protein